MAVPSRHRDALTVASAGRLILTTHPHRCLLLYPEPAWAPIRDKILAAPSFDPRSAAAKRVLVGNARDEEMDGAGRLLIAPGSHFEIWSDAGWKRQYEVADAALSANEPPPGFEDISL